MQEFTIIERFFKTLTAKPPSVITGIGDDAAVLKLEPHQQLVVTTDTLVNKVHFPENTSPEAIGFKAIAVNLSDLAAMGASPNWVTIALTVPDADENFLKGLSAGFKACLDQFGVALVGGDLTHGPLAICVTAMGVVNNNQALLRSGAKVNDKIYVTGTVGAAALALHLRRNQNSITSKDFAYLNTRLEKPMPRVKIGEAIVGVASSCIDISDGLLADLGHILQQSDCGAEIMADKIPLSATYRAHYDKLDLALTGGDDYELCFTVPPEKEAALHERIKEINVPVHAIGVITKEKTLILKDKNGASMPLPGSGYQHF